MLTPACYSRDHDIDNIRPSVSGSSSDYVLLLFRQNVEAADPLQRTLTIQQCANVNPPSLPPRPCNTSPENIAALENTTCRICLLEGSSVEDPLIRPCECKGTIEYVHLACLRHWVRGKLDLAESQSGTYFYKPMSCELCKTQYATHLQVRIYSFSLCCLLRSLGRVFNSGAGTNSNCTSIL